MRRPRRRRLVRRSGRRAPPQTRRDAQNPASIQTYEVETVSGLEEYALREIRRKLGKAGEVQRTAVEGRIALRYGGSVRRFNELRTVVAVHKVEDFAVPRPRALLGHQNLTHLLSATQSVMESWPKSTFRTFRIAAAGAGSGVYSRLRQEIAAATGLEPVDDAAHLQIAVRRGVVEGSGWQVLIRTSPRPLSARRWRVCDMPGALNSSVASIMASLCRPHPTERVLNVCCGSGTLMIERLGLGTAARVIGVDSDRSALQCADANLRAAGHRSSALLTQADCASLPLPDASIDTITADLPFGMLMSGSGDITSLYLSVLAESARVGTLDASMALITTRRRAILNALDNSSMWSLRQEIPLSIPHSRGYIKPNIYLLRRGRMG